MSPEAMNSSGAPLVSLVVPSWRHGRYLSRTLESLARQSYPHLEVLVQDNASDDETREVLARWRDAPRVRIVVERDAGQSDALGRGFRAARGDILGWLNADDLLMPEAVDVAVAALTRERADVVYGHCALIDAAGQFGGYVPGVGAFDAVALRNHTPFIAQPGVLMRREAYESTGGIDASLHFTMDWDLWCRMHAGGARFHFLPEVLAAARLLPEAKTARMSVARLREITAVNARHGVPLVPLLWGAHLAGRALRPLLSSAFEPARRAWRRATGRPAVASHAVHGLAPGNIVVDRDFAVRVPVFSFVSHVHLQVRGSSGEPLAWQASLAGASSASGGSGLELSNAHLAALDLRVRLAVPPPPGTYLELQFDFSDGDPNPAPRPHRSPAEPAVPGPATLQPVD
jgi:hypothetical protein